jgi:MFS transporter, SP family, sugar:H+ symporter
VDNATHLRNDTGSYRIPIAVQFAWAIVLIVGMLVLPETPRYCIKRGKYEKAARAMGMLRRLSPDHPAITEELAEIQANHQFEMSIGKPSYIDCFRGQMAKRQLTGMGLQALQQLTGMYFPVQTFSLLAQSTDGVGKGSISYFTMGHNTSLTVASISPSLSR